MMEKVLIFIKHNFGFLWTIIEWGNGILFSMIFRSRLLRILPRVFREFTLKPFTFRKLSLSDSGSLYGLISNQDPGDLDYFHPHDLDLKAIEKQFKNRAFLMMGVLDGSRVVGYFFLRFFSNKKCFVGRLIDTNYRGRGVGNVMNEIMYEIAWRMDFKCLSTISRNNKMVMHAHAGNSRMVVLKELQNDFLLVEFINRTGNP